MVKLLGPDKYNTVVTLLPHMFKKSLIIHKEKNKRHFKCLMNVFIFDKDTAKLYVRFFRPK